MKEDNVMVSVIIPIYNVEKYLCQCVDSVLNQTYRELQIILVDDESPDGCGNICDEYKNKDSRIEVIHKKNGGLGMARNDGLKLAKGEYVIFLDSDDWIDTNHIAKLIEAAKDNDADLVIHGYRKCTDEGNVIEQTPLIKTGVFENVINDILMPMIAADDKNPIDEIFPVGACFKMFRLSVIRDNNIEFISEKKCISEDVIFNMDCIPLYKRAVVIDDYGYNYRTNPNSISQAYDPKRTGRMFVFYHEMYDRLECDIRFTSCKEHRLSRCYIAKCRVGIRLIAKSNLSFKMKLLEIRKILSNEYTKKALKDLHYIKYGIKLSIIAWLMKMRAAELLVFLFKYW